VGDPGFFLQDQLGIAGDAGAEFGGERNRFVQRVGVQDCVPPRTADIAS
jgi:hypothetical protein